MVIVLTKGDGSDALLWGTRWEGVKALSRD